MSTPILLVAPAAVVLLPQGADSDLENRLRAGLLDTEPLSSVVHALTAAGLGALPSLAIVVRDDGGALRVFVRGDGRVRVNLSRGEHEDVSTRTGVTTWHEDLFNDATSAELGSASSSDLRIEFLVSAEPMTQLPQPDAPEPQSDAAGHASDDHPTLAPPSDTIAPPAQSAHFEEPEPAQEVMAPAVEDDDHTLHRSASPSPAAADALADVPPTPSTPVSPGVGSDETGLISSVPSTTPAPAPSPPLTSAPADPALPQTTGEDADDHTIAAADHRRLVQRCSRQPGSRNQPRRCRPSAA